MLPRFSGFLSPLSSIAPLHLFLCDLSTVFFFIFVSSEFPIGRRRCFYFLQVFNSWWESASPTCSSSTTGRGGDECGGQWEGQGVGLGVGPGGMELNWRVPFANWPAVRLASGPGRWPALGLNFFFLEIWRPFFLKTPFSFSIFFSLVLHCCSNAKKGSTCFFFPPIASSPIGGSPPQVLFLSFFFLLKISNESTTFVSAEKPLPFCLGIEKKNPSSRRFVSSSRFPNCGSRPQTPFFCWWVATPSP